MAPPRADAPEAVAVNARGELLPQQRTRLYRRIIAGAVSWLLILPTIWACTLAWLPFDVATFAVGVEKH